MRKKPARTRLPKKPDPPRRGNGMLSALMASTFIHAMLLLLLAGGFSLNLPSCQRGGQEQAQAEGGPEQQETAQASHEPIEVTIEERILPKPAESQDVAQAPEELDVDGLMTELHNAQDCPDFFGGIGITQKYVAKEDLSEGYYVVAEVHPGYPAERGGILVGDRLVTDTRTIRGEIGTPITVMVTRHGQLVTFDLVREKICISKEDADHMKKMDELEKRLENP